jgi:hypothetical protein
MNIIHALILTGLLFGVAGGGTAVIFLDGRARVVSACIAIGSFTLLGYLLLGNVERMRVECEAKGGVQLSRGYECVKKDAVIR